MISFASLFLALLVAPGTTPRDSVLPAGLASRIRGVVAERWNVDSGGIELSWGQLPSGIAQLASAEMRFPAAIDRDGWMVVVLMPTNASPQAMRIRAGQRVSVAVAARALEVGRTLDASDITRALQVRWGAPEATAPTDMLGWEVRRALQAGDVLRAPSIAPPVLVRSGEPVVFVWDRGAVHMEYQATALGSARLGETVQARSGVTRIAGTVTAHGVARLGEKPR